MAEITAVKSWADHNRAWMELLVEKIRVCSCSALLSPCYNMWLWRQINYRKPCFKILQIFHFTCSKLQLWLSCRTYFFKYACVMISGELCKSLEHHKKVRRSAFYFFLTIVAFLAKDLWRARILQIVMHSSKKVRSNITSIISDFKFQVYF